MHCFSLTIQVVVAYLVMDVISGIYHYLTDRGLNTKWQVDQFKEHHETNRLVNGIEFQMFLACLPFFLLSWIFSSYFLFFLGVFAFFSQVPHWFAHNYSDNKIVLFLQSTGLIISVKHHQDHHKALFDKNFCIMTNYNNWWLNYVTRCCDSVFFKGIV